MMFWSQKVLYSKAMSYAAKAEKDNEHRPMFAAITLEFLARTCLAHVHPTLLADPQDGKNLLYAAGIKVKLPVKSIPMKTVLKRCSEIFQLDNDLMKFSAILMEARNSELHSGDSGFHELPDDWELQYYLLCQVFLKFLVKDLDDLFPKDSVERIKKTLVNYDKGLRAKAKMQIEASKKSYAKISPADKKSLLLKNLEIVKKLNSDTRNSTLEKCPACKNTGLLWGEATEYSEPEVDTNEILYEKRILPSNFNCPTCKLSLSHFSELAAAGLAKTFILTEAEDPVAYFGINPRDHMSDSDIRDLIRDYQYDDYGND